MKKRLLVFSMLASMLAMLLVVPAAGAASPATGSATFPIDVTATCTGAGAPSSLCTAAGDALSFSGTGTITNFSVVNNTLAAAGTYTGTLSNTTTGAAQALTGTFGPTPVSASGTCPILDLTLGPLHLNLLGLVVDLNQVHLQITAQSGPGNLLGNLLCSVANLLNSSASPTALQQVANLLNRIIAIA